MLMSMPTCSTVAHKGLLGAFMCHQVLHPLAGSCCSGLLAKEGNSGAGAKGNCCGSGMMVQADRAVEVSVCVCVTGSSGRFFSEFRGWDHSGSGDGVKWDMSGHLQRQTS